MAQNSTGEPLPVFPKLSDKQLDCLKFIYEFYKQNLYYPSRREVAENMGIRPASAHQHIEYLIQKGYLMRIAGTSRNIRINPDMVVALRHWGVISPEEGNVENI